MTNKLIIAAAGSGKTTYIVKKALEISHGKILITTFTEENEKEIRNKFFEINKAIPSNVSIQTWFSFLIQHGVKPYQSLLTTKEVSGLLLVNSKSGFRYYNKKLGTNVYHKQADGDPYYFSSNDLIYSDKLSIFVNEINKISSGKIINRLAKVYQHIFIDEVQDLAGYDLELIKLLLKSDISLTMVGDPRQVTYNTHFSSKHKKYSNGCIDEFICNECKKIEVEIDKTTLNTTYRNRKEICEYANSIYPDFTSCEFIEKKSSGHDGIYFLHPKHLEDYLAQYSPIQLCHSKATKTHSSYKVLNYGKSKGLTFDRTLIYPTVPILTWIFDNTFKLEDVSRAKFYVAITRARHSVAILHYYEKKVNVPGINYYEP